MLLWLWVFSRYRTLEYARVARVGTRAEGSPSRLLPTLLLIMLCPLLVLPLTRCDHDQPCLSVSSRRMTSVPRCFGRGSPNAWDAMISLPVTSSYVIRSCFLMKGKLSCQDGRAAQNMDSGTSIHYV